MGNGILGYILSGSTTQSFSFLVAEGMETIISEGMYVLASDGERRVLGVVEELKYYHEFYEEGDVWVEAIKKGKKPPEGVGRAFLRGKARIVGEVRDGDIIPPKQPLRPGSSVYLVTGGDLKPVFGHDPSSYEDPPPHLLGIGRLFGYQDLKALIDLRAITMHLGIIGTTGSGKTNTVSVLLEELGNKKGVDAGIAKLPRTIPAIVVDLNGDYTYLYDEPKVVPQYSQVIRLVSQESPVFNKGYVGGIGKRLEPLTLDLDIFQPHELAEAVVSLYRGGPGENIMLQLNLLTYIFSKLIPEKFSHLSRNIIFSEKSYYDELIKSVENLAQGRKNEQEDMDGIRFSGATVHAVIRQLDNFRSSMKNYGLLSTQPTVTREFMEDVTDPENPKLVLVDLSSEGMIAPLNVKQFVVYYLALLLFNLFVEYRNMAVRGEGNQRVALLILEEAQNFAPNPQTYKLGYSVAKSILSTIATQGRKFGLSLVLVSQRPIYVDQVVMSMMNTFIIHRVPPFDVKFVENLTGGITLGLARNLSVMERGTAIIVGQMNPSPLPLVVRIRRRRG